MNKLEYEHRCKISLLERLGQNVWVSTKLSPFWISLVIQIKLCIWYFLKVDRIPKILICWKYFKTSNIFVHCTLMNEFYRKFHVIYWFVWTTSKNIDILISPKKSIVVSKRTVLMSWMRLSIVKIVVDRSLVVAVSWIHEYFDKVQVKLCIDKRGGIY